ncbi:MAG: MTH1187 family thiamine-binding protein [Calditrichaceae bacterium]
MVLLEFTMSPLDKGESLSPYVARILDIIDRSGVTYQLSAMATILEGEYTEVMDVVRKCFLELEKDCSRISISVKIDYRKGSESRLRSKTDRVENILGRKLNILGKDMP